jgi:hypothetical protein
MRGDHCVQLRDKDSRRSTVVRSRTLHALRVPILTASWIASAVVACTGEVSVRVDAGGVDPGLGSSGTNGATAGRGGSAGSGGGSGRAGTGGTTSDAGNNGGSGGTMPPQVGVGSGDRDCSMNNGECGDPEFYTCVETDDGGYCAVRPPSGCMQPGTPAEEPYAWYPQLDLAQVPFHRDSGPWGDAAPIAAPAPPVTTRRVEVRTARELQDAGVMPGTEITVMADFTNEVILADDVRDIDLIVPPGRTIGPITIGSHTPPSTTTRVRIRGPVPGQLSGGTVGSIHFLSATSTDLIIDGVDMNGEDDDGGSALWWTTYHVERLAIVNVRGHAVGSGTLQSGTDIVIAGSNLVSGARTMRENGEPGGWNIRGGSRMVIFDNRLEGNRYHRVRVHPLNDGPRQHVWVSNNIFVDRREARIFWAQDLGNRGEPIAGVWTVCNTVFADTSCLAPSFEAADASYAQLTNNAFFGVFTADGQRTLERQHGPGRDYQTGNTFAAWREPPAWGTVGDPLAVPLPELNRDRYDPNVMGSCPD